MRSAASRLTGIGPGTFAFYWSQHGPIYESIQNAHSLYIETLAETGLVGFTLIVTALLVMLVTGIARTLRAPPLDASGSCRRDGIIRGLLRGCRLRLAVAAGGSAGSGAHSRQR